MSVYPPYVKAGYKDTNPPIPGHPCKYDKSKVIVGTDTQFVRNSHALFRCLGGAV
jgi:hypothetical protein